MQVLLTPFSLNPLVILCKCHLHPSMPVQLNSTRQRLIKAASELFISQGISETTTKQIAERAQVNEVTLFRHFGHKHGLLLAVMEETSRLNSLGEVLIESTPPTIHLDRAIKEYATHYLDLMEKAPALLRSLIGESGQYPRENRQALGRLWTEADRYLAQYLGTAIAPEGLQQHLSLEKLAALLHGVLLGYTVIELTSEFHQLWQDREDFLQGLITLFLGETIASAPECTTTVKDLPANLVHLLLQRAKRLSLKDYALVYLLFATGVELSELISLERTNVIRDNKGHLLQISHPQRRQVPLNQWILGKRYGSARRNPLTQWLKSRQDHERAMFVDESGKPLGEDALRCRWERLAAGLLAPEGETPTLEQARQTWCVEMLMRGITLEELSLLSGCSLSALEPYLHRAREKAALEQAIHLDATSPRDRG